MEEEISVCQNKGLLEYVRKSNPPPFLLKTYMLVEDPATNDTISWNGEGTGFVVWQPAEFARDLLPTLFKHSNFSSFVRQLNTYGFHKVAASRWEFCNKLFRKGERELLCDIRRRKAWANKTPPRQIQSKPGPMDYDEEQKSSSTSSSSGLTILVDENKRLKEENGALSSELTSTKKKCRELLELVAKFAHNLEEKEEDERPKLFGVRLEVQGEKEMKRKRLAEISESASCLLSQSCK